MTVHGRTADYLDGKLTKGEENAFIEHLLDCAACEAALVDELQLRDREEVLREGACRKRLLGVIRLHDLAGFAIIGMQTTVFAAARWLLRFASRSRSGPPTPSDCSRKRGNRKERASIR